MWRARAGTNLVEVVMAAALAGVVLLGMGGFITSSFRATRNERDRAYALQKALQMMEEVSAYKPSDPHDQGIDRFDGSGDFALSTADGVSADDALSGNPKVGAHYKYVRRVTVAPVEGDGYARQVTVSVWYATADGQPHIPNKAPLAVVSNVVRSNAAKVGPRQILDVYALSIENLPHILRKDEYNQYFPGATDARRMFEAALRGIQDRDPWLGFRIHYITRLSTGRDPYYRPYINDAKPLSGSSRDPLTQAYFYPGRLFSGLDAPRYYDPDVMGCQVLRDAPGGAVSQGTYAACDEFNHAVRAARELDDQGRPILPAGVHTDSALSLRQFLEEMVSDNTGKYRNAIVVNLHGELFPAIPLRNYSDAAKDPADPDPAARKRRLVTQPYKLGFVAGADTVRLLVHPYMADGSQTPAGDSDVTTADSFPAYARHARLTVKGLRPYLAAAADGSGEGGANDVTVEVVQREQTANGTAYKRLQAWPADGADETDARRGAHSGPHVLADVHHGGGTDPHFDGDDFVVDLQDLDYDARGVKDGADAYGLPGGPGGLLNGLQYFPDPYLPFLDERASGAPRNTARVVVSFKLQSVAAHHRFDVVTQLQEASGGLAVDSPAEPGTSHTSIYAIAPGDWDATRRLYWNASSNMPAIPLTEQVQLVGDPRDNPYLDVRARNLFNPYFKALDGKAEVYPGIKATGGLDAANPYAGLPANAQGGYDAGYPGSADDWAGLRYNAPAYLRLWREVLVRNDALFVNLNGLPLRFLGQGGEFILAHKVADQGDVHVSSKPYDGGNGNADDRADELLANPAPVIQRAAGPAWQAVPWLGELYPADRGSDWVTLGNLPAGTFVRKPDGSKREVAGAVGLASMLNAESGAGSGPPSVGSDGAAATLTTTGSSDMVDALGLNIAHDLQTPVRYTLSGGATPPEWSSAPYAAHDALGWLDAPFGLPGYFNETRADGQAVASALRLRDAATAHQAIVLADGFYTEGVTQTLSMLQTAASTAVAAYFDGTRQALGGDNVKPLPRVKLKSPVAGAAISGGAVDLVWYANSTRGDGKAYSPLFGYPTATAPEDGGPLDVVYFVKYRNLSSGGPWTTAALSSPVQSASATMADNGPVVDGVPVAGAGVVPIPNEPRYPEPVRARWEVAALEPGDYLLRVEAFRVDGGRVLPTHYAYHEIPVTLVH